MNKINIYNETGKEIPYTKIMKKVIKEAYHIEKIKNASCSIIIVNNDYIHNLNKTYRKIDKETDVITFALEDDKTCLTPKSIRLLGDIYISLDKAITQAEEYGHSLERELCFLAVHGFYHLLGYDHQTKEEEEIMFKKQEEVLTKYGIKRNSKVL